MNKTAIIVLVIVVILLCCCTATGIGIFAFYNYSKTVDTALINTTNSNLITEVPYEINTFLDQTDLDNLQSNGLKVNKGYNAPQINGSFLVDNWTVKYDKQNSMKPGDAISTCTYTFSNQSSNGSVDYSYQCSDEKGKGELAYISGKDSCFTVYVNSKGTTANCEFSNPVIISGCLNDKGITQWQYSTLLKTKTAGTTCDSEVMPLGNIRLISIDDSEAEKQ